MMTCRHRTISSPVHFVVVVIISVIVLITTNVHSGLAAAAITNINLLDGNIEEDSTNTIPSLSSITHAPTITFAPTSVKRIGRLPMSRSFMQVGSDGTQIPATSAPTAAPTSEGTYIPTFQPTTIEVNLVSRHLQEGHQCPCPTSSPTKKPSGPDFINPGGRTPAPVPQRSEQPSKRPSTNPSSQPSALPSKHPSKQPSSEPSGRPTVSLEPSTSPSSRPTMNGTMAPSTSPAPSSEPSVLPSEDPSSSPSVSSMPSDDPSSIPSESPQPTPKTNHPSASPSVSSMPSASPSSSPSESPQPTPKTNHPSSSPSVSSMPSDDPSSSPSVSSMPSESPSSSPSMSPQPTPKTNHPSSSPSVSSMPSDDPSASPTVSSMPSASPSSSPSVSSMPSDDPSSSPSVSSMPSQSPSATPSVSSSPSREPSGKPSTSSSPSREPSFAPSLSWMPSGQPSFGPSEKSQCVLKQNSDGIMTSCGDDGDCDGGRCVAGNGDSDSCACECNGCLVSKTGQDVGCSFKCDGCEELCTTYNASDPSSTDWLSGECNATASCTTCTNSSACNVDQDCVILPDEDSGICVGSGFCTKEKNKLCDEAWNVIMGGNDKSAKCCPASSGCIKGAIGVIATSTCSVTCGTKCLGVTDKNSKYLPSTFCTFGQRLQGMANCTFLAAVEDNDREDVQCGADTSDEICCTSNPESGTGSLKDYDGPGPINCADGHPNATAVSGGDGEENKYYYHNNITDTYMCIQELDQSISNLTSTVANYQDPNTFGAAGMAPKCT